MYKKQFKVFWHFTEVQYCCMKKCWCCLCCYVAVCSATAVAVPCCWLLQLFVTCSRLKLVQLDVTDEKQIAKAYEFVESHVGSEGT